MADRIAHGGCCACGQFIRFRPDYVPRIHVIDSQKPLCQVCFTAWNELNRIAKGLEPLPLHPMAYASLWEEA